MAKAAAVGWYPTYYEYGVNWASESTIPEEEWASTEYYKTAFAELLDYLVVGCYFRESLLRRQKRSEPNGG